MNNGMSRIQNNFEEYNTSMGEIKNELRVMPENMSVPPPSRFSSAIIPSSSNSSFSQNNIWRSRYQGPNSQ